ncbi:MAG TPA: aminotransferase class III-fold pyridoxal phosphate-dependent enzyme [Candidatus Omnitrophota bacterium]|nr:aminotransferase class III-fold pyridoxal phosphate-dependent enzyme [Candidatus Omnitrophota bacterium]
MKLEKSKKLLSKANNCIAGQTMTMSKRADQFVAGVYPAYVESAKGFVIVDVDGNHFVDFMSGLGTIILGYNHPGVNRAIKKQLESGSLFSLPHRLEVKFAEEFQRHFPYVEKLKVLKTGSEAVSAAIRIARTYTGRDNVLSCAGYHGWHDCAMHKPPANGVPMAIRRMIDLVHPIEGTKIPFEPNTIAAIIVEPVMLDQGTKQWLQALREYCDENGIVLIFDEIITGMRVPGYSIANWFNITPDLSCFGKAMGNGMPIAVVGGKRELMDSDYFVSSTYGGEVLSMAAALEVFRVMTPAELNALWMRGGDALHKFNRISKHIKIRGYNTRGQIEGDTELFRALFWQEMLKEGWLLGKAWFLTLEHDEDLLTIFIDCSTKVIRRIEAGGVQLEGSIPKEAIKR